MRLRAPRAFIGFHHISREAAALENMLIEKNVPLEAVDRALDGLLATIERE